jgi:hypothetical protein
MVAGVFGGSLFSAMHKRTVPIFLVRKIEKQGELLET